MPPRKACDVCFKRKIQCAISTPGLPCDWCRHHEVDCTFLREPQKKRKNCDTPDADHELVQRVLALESQLAALAAQITSPKSAKEIDQLSNQHEHSPATTDGTRASSALPSLNWRPRAIAGRKSAAARSSQTCDQLFGLNWYYKGMPVYSERGWDWISLRTAQANLAPQKLLLKQVQQNRAAIYPSPANSHPTYQECCELPEEHRARKAVDILFASPTRFGLVALDRDRCSGMISKAYESEESLPAKACVWALCANASRLQEPTGSDLLANGEECAARAQALLGLLSTDFSIETLYAVLLLHKHYTSVGQQQQSSLQLSLACRIICDLGGHVTDPASSNIVQDSELGLEYETEHIRLLFWHCYVLDKDNSLRTGRPSLLPEEYCDLTLPVDEASLEHLPYDPRLGMAKEKICRLLYTPQASRTSDSDLLLQIRQLDSDLEQWRLSIPMSIRPKLAIAIDRPFFPTEMQTLQRIRYISLQLDYHYALTCVHTAVERCGSVDDQARLPEYLHQVLHSSNDISLEAARSTLLILRPLIDLLQQGAFSHLALYAPVASLSLFTNILVHPRHPRAQSDLEILAAAAGVFRTIPLRALSDGQIQHIRYLGELNIEIVRLGNLAMWKHKIEEVEQVASTRNADNVRGIDL